LFSVCKVFVATPTVRKRYADVIKRRAEERENERKVQLEAAGMLTGKVVTFNRKVTKTDKLYAAVTAEDISKALFDQHAITMPAAKIQVSEPIKSVGTVQVQVQIGDAQYPLSVTVLKEEAKAWFCCRLVQFGVVDRDVLR
jgi:large subunit ribosomal protein L9